MARLCLCLYTWRALAQPPSPGASRLGTAPVYAPHGASSCLLIASPIPDFPTQQHFLPIWTSSLQDLGQDKKRRKLKAERTTELLLLPPSSTLSSIMVTLVAGIFADATEGRCRGGSLSQMWYATNL